MTDKRKTPVRPIAARRWCVIVGTRGPFGPALPVAVAIPEPLVVEGLRHAFRGDAIQVEEARAVEMIRDGAVVVARRGGAQSEDARDRPDRGETGEQAAAGEEGHR